ncbi:MAG: DMT family transporter [Gammaproteobacteria bacterium]|nr:DMT family transporter [Gammaproteobacteria bacterium]
MKQSFATGLVAAFAAVTFWGLQLPIAKDVFGIVDPFHVTVLRYCVATLCLAPLLVKLEGLAALSYGPKLVPACVLGVTGMCASPMLVFLGMSMSRAEYAVVIVSLQPSFAAIAQWALHGRRPATFTLGAIALAFSGVVLVVTKGDLQTVHTAKEIFGAFIVLSGALCWVFYTMGTERLAGWSTWRITVLTMIPGAVACLVVTETLVVAGVLHPPAPAALSGIVWQLAYLTVFGVLLSMLAWNYGTRNIGALNSTLLINFMPVMTFGYRTWQGHRFEAVEIAGASMVVAALVANNLFLRRQFLRQAAR